MKSLILYTLMTIITVSNACAELVDINLARRQPNIDLPNRALVMPFMDNPILLPHSYIDSFFRIKLLTYGENVYLYPEQSYKDLVGKNYATAYLSCHYGDNWVWAVDDFDIYGFVYGKWGKFFDKPDEFVFAITTNNNDLQKMRRDCKRSLEKYGVKIANSHQISFGVNHSYVWGTRLTQYDLVFYSAPDENGLSYLIIN